MSKKTETVLKMSDRLTTALEGLLEKSDNWRHAYQRCETAAEMLIDHENLNEIGEDHQIIDLTPMFKEQSQANIEFEDGQKRLIIAALDVASAWLEVKILSLNDEATSI